MAKGEKMICTGCEEPGDACIQIKTPDGLRKGIEGDDGGITACPLPFISAVGVDISEFKPVTNVKTVFY